MQKVNTEDLQKIVLLRYGSSDMSGTPIRSFRTLVKLTGLPLMTITQMLHRFQKRGVAIDARHFNGTKQLGHHHTSCHASSE